MQSRSSITAAIKGSQPTLVDKENEAPPPTTAVAVAQIIPEADPFIVQINKDDPTHAMVCVSRLFSSRLTGID